MKHSEQLDKIIPALIKAKSAFKPIVKDAENPFFRSKYADLPTVIDATEGALSDNGLAVSQGVDYSDGMTFLVTMLVHTSGQWLSSRLPLNPVKNTPQEMGSAITYARRYALSAILSVASEDDDDGNAATHEEKPKKEEPKKRMSEDETIVWVQNLENEINSAATVDALTNVYGKLLDAQKNGTISDQTFKVVKGWLTEKKKILKG